MRSLAEVQDTFAYHPATPETAGIYDAVRRSLGRCAEELWELLPDGADKTLVMRDLQRALHLACSSVAMTTPADHKHATVARVLPFTECSCGRYRFENVTDAAPVSDDGVQHTTIECRTPVPAGAVEVPLSTGEQAPGATS